MQEIERKFLVDDFSFIEHSHSQTRIVQAYLNSHPERNVRIRIKGDKGFLTIKGMGNDSGTTRFEWEKEISIHEAEKLLPLCEPGAIDKIRYEVKVGLHIFEIDVFEGSNKGLIIAEIELSSENEEFEKPVWIGKEVTGEAKYYNSSLVKNPFLNW